ncbi:Glycosyl hydrolase family 20, catalytic domain [Verrucomicrobiia bacterium DG1235]|nr:Glycosyl hydrolase family 20, catalytic domain [Verrucomicrobiae bacterium DG1235]
MHLFPPPQTLAYTRGSLRQPSQSPTLHPSTFNLQPSSYTLSITPKGISITAASPEAAHYAQVTLNQILAQHPDGQIPCLEITDWPDLPVRGYMLDISRCKVPTQASLFQLIDLLASLKYNQLQLYTEHTFAYRDHPQVWQDASPLTPADIQALDAYCKDRYIELVPNQNSFGHMERWLRHPAYHPFAESPKGFEHPISGWKEHGSTLKPTPASADFADSLFAELLPNFTSRQLNVGGDEPWELGQGYSREQVGKRGKTRVYLDHLLRIQKKVQARGYEMQFWGDIIINQPELAAELDPDVTALLWGYEADHPFADHCAAMQSARANFTLVPGTSTWNSIGGRLQTALPNIDSAAANAKRYAANGLLLTEWGDNGHHHSNLTSILPILQAAARAWHPNTEPLDLEIPATQLIPNPLSKSEYTALIELSSIAASFSTYLHNASWLNKILFAQPKQFPQLAPQLIPAELETARQRLRSLATTGKLELAHQLLLHAARKGIALTKQKQPAAFPAELLETYRHHWLARNRPGGLEESIAYLTPKP